MTILLGILGALLVLALILKVANPLPSHDGDPKDLPLPKATSAIVQHLDEMAAEHPGETGLHLLPTGIDAFAMRLALVQSAQQSIDARYYIWEGDLSGKMLLSEIIKAADRGVRVRLLIDDNPTAGLDPMWAAVTSHPNINVKLFNPLVIRKPRVANYLFDFLRLNRRMHNKSFTVDGTATIIGGRNVGDEYFDAKSEGLFIDLDALAFGAILDAEEKDFERYWTSEPAFPAEKILSPVNADAINALRNPVYEDAGLARNYRVAADEAIATLAFKSPEDLITWAPVQLVSDNPDKALNKAAESDLLAYKIAPLIQSAQTRFDLVSGYFVPSTQGTKLLTDLAHKNVPVRVVTNSVGVTDVPVVHAGYAPYRPELIQAGVKLYEAQPADQAPGDKTSGNDAPKTSRAGSGPDFGTRFSGGGESVHAKTFAIDDKILFVGSFNFDPRSALLNCEMGFIIQSPELAQALTNAMNERVDEHAYRVTEDADGKLNWIDQTAGRTTTYTTEPNTTAFERGMVWFLSKLPIEWLL